MFKVIYRFNGEWTEEILHSYDEAQRIANLLISEGIYDIIKIREITT